MRKRTLRKLPPETRKLARLVGELQSVTRRLKNLLPVVQQLEHESQALFSRVQLELRSHQEAVESTRKAPDEGGAGQDPPAS